MRARHVDLPEPANRIWSRATALVAALLIECKTLEDDKWHLGGGTALSAEWRHRNSTDIDILIAPGLSMASLHGDSKKRLTELINATNGTRIDAPDQKLSVTYGEHGKVDIFSSGRQLPGHEERIEVAGRTTLRLSNAQIFAGKFRRAIDQHVAARDLFDVCHAARIRDPGMQQALNTLTEPEHKRITEFWHNSSQKIEEEARKKLTGISATNWITPDQLVERTLRTTENHLYAGIVITASKDRTTVQTITREGLSNEYRSTNANIKRDFHALGITRNLMLHNIRASQIIQDAREAMTQDIKQIVVQTGPKSWPHISRYGKTAPEGATSPSRADSGRFPQQHPDRNTHGR